MYLVARSDQGANKTGDDHDLIDQDGVEDRGPWQTSSQEDVHEQQGRGDDPCIVLALFNIPIMSQCLPVNVANVEDLTKGAGNLGIGTDELRANASLSQVGAHGEIGDAGDHGDSSGDVVEEAVCARFGE